MTILHAIENKLIYFPCGKEEGDWKPAEVEFEDVHFSTSDGLRLHGWYCPCPEEFPSVTGDSDRVVFLFFHGNAGNLSHRVVNIIALERTLGADVFIIDYRGYGHSEGSPSEEGLYLDSRAAYAWLTDTRGVDADRIVLLGRSLGGAVALELGLEVPHRCLILESTFTSLPDLAKKVYPWLPARWLMKAHYPSGERIDRYAQPVLITHGQLDSLIPIDHARELYRLANEPKRLLEVPGADHNDVMFRGGKDYLGVLHEFLCESFPEICLPNMDRRNKSATRKNVCHSERSEESSLLPGDPSLRSG